ncbi:uncharacterized protein TRUGW13939_03244 [Talaromyces rugulosus]|uniref:NAD dependent epimerase/dehydratase n=1 Tax=Talaromyces rugulosus TaxID=121627 RepID=A0A7H8QQA6_TALRU|nr:uncharacterized protein TRUGW13939_03244 [Talaromyces rugulosus]QKX56144.1 hypothetical protein TRUGW13939_03244 [Talaromyces rugulosus]
MADLQLYQWIWPLRQPSRTRPTDKPMAVLGLGMPRTGTESLKAALEELGYATYHGFEPAGNPGDCVTWCNLIEQKNKTKTMKMTTTKTAGKVEPLTAKDFDKVLGHCQAVSDTPSICFADEMIAAYPDAKTILNYRPNIDAWQKSITAVVGRNEALIGTLIKRVLVLFSPELFWLQQHVNRIDFDTLWRGDIIANATTVYKEHYAHLEKTAPPERTLRWCVQDGWEPLCELLGKPVPNKPFPHKNTPEEQQKVLAKRLWPLARDAILRFVLTMVVVAAGGCWLWARWR